MLTHEEIQTLSKRRETLSRSNSADKRATNPPEDMIKARNKELGQINRTLKKHYAERDAKQQSDRDSQYLRDSIGRFDNNPPVL